MELQGGRRTTIQNVNIGDKVLTMDRRGQLIYSEVYYIPHEPSDATFEYLDIHYTIQGYNATTATMLQVTRHHLVYTSTSDELGEIHLNSLHQLGAKDLKPGMSLVVHHQVRLCARQGPERRLKCHQDQLHWAKIDSIGTSRNIGAYTLYTMNGRFLVNGVLCSNFGDFYQALGASAPDAWPYAYFSTHRALYRVLPSPSTSLMLKVVNDNLIFPFLRWLNAMV